MSEARETLRAGASGEAEQLVTLAKPGPERDIVLLTQHGPIRFIEGRARVPLSVAEELSRRPGWALEP